MTGIKPNTSNMQAFGIICYAYVPNKRKLDARSEKGIFVAYDNGSLAYLVYFPKWDKIRKVESVKFTDNFVNGNSELIA